MGVSHVDKKRGSLVIVSIDVTAPPIWTTKRLSHEAYRLHTRHGIERVSSFPSLLLELDSSAGCRNRRTLWQQLKLFQKVHRFRRNLPESYKNCLVSRISVTQLDRSRFEIYRSVSPRWPFRHFR